MLSFKKVNIPNEIKIDPRFEKLPLKNLFIFSFISSLMFLVISLVSNLILPPQIPIFYGLPKTTEQLGKSIYIILPSLVSILITIINAVLAINIESQHQKRILAFSSLLVSILAIVTTYKIIALVGSI